MTSITLTIDGHIATVAEGTTVLEAAATVGIVIPTLCYVREIDPTASCFLCCVQIEGSRTVSPSCALPAADGMVVTTDSNDLRAMRKMALELLLSDHAGDCVAPCAVQCPAGLDIPGYVYGIAAYDTSAAMEVLNAHLAVFPGTLGRICPRLCEESCRRCDHDEGLAIASLHRFAADRALAEGTADLSTTCRESTGKSVAIVGAGPAGLSAAYYLLLEGHACTLYEAHPNAGGMLRYGIPSYRLPRQVLEGEVARVVHLGAQIHTGRRWGRDFDLSQLRAEHDAVFLAIGAQDSRSLRCPGENLALSGIDLLRRVASGDTPDVGDRVVVIGGGNTAMDAARTAVRLGAKEVRVLYRRTRAEMPCLLEEVEAAEEEGIRVEYLVAPLTIERTDTCLRLESQLMELGEKDASGRRAPVPLEGSEQTLECDSVIAAVGQAVDLELAVSEGLEVTRWGLDVDQRTGATSRPGVFAGGDAVLGADLAVRAVAAGRLAAASINQYLDGEPVVGLGLQVSVALRRVSESERANLFREIERSPQVATSTLEIRTRLAGFDEVDRGLSEQQALAEARRCLSCGCRKAHSCDLRSLATDYDAEPYRFVGQRRSFQQDLSHPELVYEPGKCIMCEACVRIAEEAGEDLGVSIIGRGFDVSVGVPFDASLSTALRTSWRECAEACPTAALALRTARSCDLDGCGGAREQRTGLPIVYG